MRSDPFFHSTFPRARRREAYRRLLRIMRKRDREPLLELDDFVIEEGDFVGERRHRRCLL